MGGPGPLRQFIDLAAPQHPTLVDETHLLDARFGVTNIPQNIWIDETGTIVRPAEPGSPAPVYVETDDPTYAVVMQYMHERHPDPGWYSDRIRDWVSKGADSEYAMRPDEVIKASQPRTPDVSRAAAHFELGQHLELAGDHEGAIGHWREAHRLDPANWTYKRNAWSLEDPHQGRTEAYDSCWFEDVLAIGAEHYYPPLVP